MPRDTEGDSAEQWEARLLLRMGPGRRCVGHYQWVPSSPWAVVCVSDRGDSLGPPGHPLRPLRPGHSSPPGDRGVSGHQGRGRDLDWLLGSSSGMVRSWQCSACAVGEVGLQAAWASVSPAVPWPSQLSMQPGAPRKRRQGQAGGAQPGSPPSPPPVLPGGSSGHGPMAFLCQVPPDCAARGLGISLFLTEKMLTAESGGEAC